MSSQQVDLLLRQVALLLQQVDMSAQQVDTTSRHNKLTYRHNNKSTFRHSKSKYCYNKSTFHHSKLTSRQSLHHPQFINSKFKTTMALISLFAPIHMKSLPKVKLSQVQFVFLRKCQLRYKM